MRGSSREAAREFCEAGRAALESGRVRAAALLACAGLEAAGSGGERAAKLREAVSLGFTPSAGEVEALLDELEGLVGVAEGEVVLEVDLGRALLAGAGAALAGLVLLSALPAWADALLIPGAAASLLLALLKR